MTNQELLDKVKKLLFGEQTPEQPTTTEVVEEVAPEVVATTEEVAPETTETVVEVDLAKEIQELRAQIELMSDYSDLKAEVERLKGEVSSMDQKFTEAAKDTLQIVTNLSNQPTDEPAQTPKESIFKKPGTPRLSFHNVLNNK
jgi:molecular chaperone GrpE (heat shock protein)